MGDAQYAYGRMRTAYSTYRQCVQICQTGGYGHIEVANRYMVLNMRRYLNEFREAQAEIGEAIDMARQVGNLRAEMVALLLRGEFLTDAAAYQDALVSLDRALEIGQSFGNLRMSAYIRGHQARALAASGHLVEARSMVGEAWSGSQQTDPVFIGARICGTRALLAPDRQSRLQALGEGEKIVRSCVLAHNVIWFLRDAIEASLLSKEWNSAEAYASRLEEFTGGEPIPVVRLFIQRGRVLRGAWARSQKSEESCSILPVKPVKSAC